MRTAPQLAFAPTEADPRVQIANTKAFLRNVADRQAAAQRYLSYTQEDGTRAVCDETGCFTADRSLDMQITKMFPVGDEAKPRRIARLLDFYRQLDSLHPDLFAMGYPRTTDDLVTMRALDRTPSKSTFPSDLVCADDPYYRDANHRGCLYQYTTTSCEESSEVRDHCPITCDRAPAYQGNRLVDPVDCMDDPNEEVVYTWTDWAPYMIHADVKNTMVRVKAKFAADAFSRNVMGSLQTAIDEFIWRPRRSPTTSGHGRPRRLRRRRRRHVPRPRVDALRVGPLADGRARNGPPTRCCAGRSALNAGPLQVQATRTAANVRTRRPRSACGGSWASPGGGNMDYPQCQLSARSVVESSQEAQWGATRRSRTWSGASPSRRTCASPTRAWATISARRPGANPSRASCTPRPTCARRTT